MTLTSLFAGIGGFDLGAECAGIRTAVQVEFEPSCRKILKHFNAAQANDVRALLAVYRRILKGKPIENADYWNDIIHRIRTSTILAGGFPCQDVSLAGTRSGLAGERSGLWFVFRKLIAYFRPRWVVIENVPGLLSSNGGADMGAILFGLAQLGYCASYRSFDVQYFGLAQRRERVFIVASLGTDCSAKVLFEPESVCGDSPPRRQTGEEVTGTLGCGFARRGYDDRGDPGGVLPVVVGTINAEMSKTFGQAVQDVGKLIVTGSVTTKWGKKGGPAGDECYNLVADPIVCKEGKTYTNEGSGNFKVRNLILEPVAIQEVGRRTGSNNDKGKVGVGISDPGDPMYTLQAKAQHGVYFGQRVRRLTPLECERLQGFPDGWTEGFSDQRRYHMLGNAVPPVFAAWIFKRIKAIRSNDTHSISAPMAGRLAP